MNIYQVLLTAKYVHSNIINRMYMIKHEKKSNEASKLDKITRMKIWIAMLSMLDNSMTNSQPWNEINLHSTNHLLLWSNYLLMNVLATCSLLRLHIQSIKNQIQVMISVLTNLITYFNMYGPRWDWNILDDLILIIKISHLNYCQF